MGDFDLFGGGFSFGDTASSLRDSMGSVMNYTPPLATPPAESSWFGDLAQNVTAGAKQFGSGVKDALSPFADVAKGIAPLISVGAPIAGIVAQQQAAGQMREQNKLAGRALRTQEQTARDAAGAAAPLTQFGSDALARAQRGEIPPAIQAQIDQWAQAQKAKMRQYLASAGLGDSQTMVQMDGYIDAQAQAMAGQFLQGQQQQGIGALTGAAGALTGAGGVAGGVQQRAGAQAGSLEQLIAQANAEMAKVTGSGG